MSSYSNFVSFFKKIADAAWFKNTITAVILFAGVLVGIETYQEFAAQHKGLIELLNAIVLVIFVIEIVVKILAEGKEPWNFFKDGWNVFDFIIVAAAFLPFGSGSIAILRLLRLLRVLKLINALPKLQMIVSALLKSIPSMGYVTVLLLLLFYIYAVAGVFFFGPNDPIHFANLETSMLSLFRVVTLEDWTDVMYINMFGCSNYGYDGNMDLCTQSMAQAKLSVIFFVSFVLMGTMIILNLFIGVIMKGMEEAESEMQLNAAKESGNVVNVSQLEVKLEEMQKLLTLYKNQNVEGA